ncbi:heavy metal translocating P-type ATPase [Minwuia sp.]|uniref:heavy metal translocating P-type ATPase n=1 Tax=Minwuia sp. TaxID=2493630 RepID=UPI003A94C1BD
MRDLSGALQSLDLLVPGVHCAGCISRVEGAVLALEGVSSARLNLTTRRLSVRHADALRPERIIAAVEGQGYDCRRFDAAEAGAAMQDREGRTLLRALAVAGFAAGNVMLLSVSVWSGADGATRDLFHWISALIALPAIAVAGQPFFRSAWQALRQRHLNMDVPISLAVILAAILSLDATVKGGEEAFFDAAVMLLFFLLVGRYLDHRVRARARSAVSQLLSLWSSEATRLVGGETERVAIEQIAEGDLLLVSAGERMPVDGIVERGTGDLDCAIVTGEAEPVTVVPGDAVRAGTQTLTHPLTIRATAVGEDTFLAQVVRLMEGAERSRGRHVRLADRAARIYAPAVHLVAALTFAGWMLAGATWGEALWIAVSVLIITCPCALGLAVPAVQVVASGALFRAGILLKDGAALERLAEADRAAFDKTGTVTMGQPRVTGSDLQPPQMELAAALARHSRHPLAVALASFASQDIDPGITGIVEHPGQGLSGVHEGMTLRLGKPSFVGVPDPGEAGGSELWFAMKGTVCGRVTLEDALRPDAVETIGLLERAGLDPVLLSGDNAGAVARTARQAGFAHWQSALEPADKIAALDALKAAGHRPVMVGDGINDAPALAAAHVSIAPASASDVGRAAADLVFTGDSLAAVATARHIATGARRLIIQNFGLALGYNLIAIPIAVLGGASPLVAAIAMSSSSIVVTLNALRLRWRVKTKAASAPAATLKEMPA